MHVPIGRFAEVTGLTIKTLRHYDAIGLLQPDRVDSVTGYRYYAIAQSREAMVIKALRALDVPLDEVAVMVACWQEPAVVRRHLDAHQLRLQAMASAMELRLSFVHRLLEQGDAMPYDVTTKSLGPTPAVMVRTALRHDERGLVEGDRRVSVIYEQVANHLLAEGVEFAPIGVRVTHRYDDDYSDSSYGFPVSTPTATKGLFEYTVLEAGDFLSLTHVGPVEELSAAFAAMAEAAAHLPTGEWRVLCYDDTTTTDPRLIRWEILAPLT